jgi:hypothetical protein
MVKICYRIETMVKLEKKSKGKIYEIKILTWLFITQIKHLKQYTLKLSEKKIKIFQLK